MSEWKITSVSLPGFHISNRLSFPQLINKSGSSEHHEIDNIPL